MAFLQESRKHQCFCGKICIAVVSLLLFFHIALRKIITENTWEKRALLASTELPVEYIDPTSIDLTQLVNALLNTTHTGKQQLFSLLSVTSHSSLALHTLNILVYNISDFRNIDPSIFPMRYCYCLTNRTNDLTDFTAILLDIMDNSTSYLHELFKSNSILSVSQNNDSDCIFICVMAGKTDRDLSLLWEMASRKPLFNHTVSGTVPTGKDSTSTLVPTSPLPQAFVETATSTLGQQSSTPPFATFPVTGTTPKPPRSGCPWEKPKEVSELVTTPVPVTIRVEKLNSCMLELCKFFQQCLCRVYTKKLETRRYCTDYHSWYLKYTKDVCKRVKQIPFSQTLRQKCLARMCKFT